MNTDNTPTNGIPALITTAPIGPACGNSGRPNLFVAPHELFSVTLHRPSAMRALHINGTIYGIERDPQGRPTLIELDDHRSVMLGDNTAVVAVGPTELMQDGDKVAFDHMGDVWTLVAVEGHAPMFVEC